MFWNQCAVSQKVKKQNCQLSTVNAKNKTVFCILYPKLIFGNCHLPSAIVKTKTVYCILYTKHVFSWFGWFFVNLVEKWLINKNRKNPFWCLWLLQSLCAKCYGFVFKNKLLSQIHISYHITIVITNIRRKKPRLSA